MALVPKKRNEDQLVELNTQMRLVREERQKNADHRDAEQRRRNQIKSASSTTGEVLRQNALWLQERLEDIPLHLREETRTAIDAFLSADIIREIQKAQGLLVNAERKVLNYFYEASKSQNMFDISGPIPSPSSLPRPTNKDSSDSKTRDFKDIQLFMNASCLPVCITISTELNLLAWNSAFLDQLQCGKILSVVPLQKLEHVVSLEHSELAKITDVIADLHEDDGSQPLRQLSNIRVGDRDRFYLLVLQRFHLLEMGSRMVILFQFIPSL